MADWQRTLDLADLWQAEANGEMTTSEVAAKLAERLKALKPFGVESVDSERDDLVEEFTSMGEDPETDSDDFNYVMDQLYDWADTSLDGRVGGKKVCWIKTF
jgi:hypothetical protein